jgi:hypothetical protein
VELVLVEQTEEVLVLVRVLVVLLVRMVTL